VNERVIGIGVNWSVFSSHEIILTSNICKECLVSVNIFLVIVALRGLKEATILHQVKHLKQPVASENALVFLYQQISKTFLL